MNTESQQVNNQIKLNREQNKAALWSALIVIVFSFLLVGPQYLPGRIVTIVLGVVPAFYMTWFLHTYPDSMRNRSGSLVMAIYLVAFLWLVAVVSVVGVVAGVIE